ncbi:MAG: YbhB/YbcL family Raf kinase inhibitor-like protein [Candidatus Binatia bacterium]
MTMQLTSAAFATSEWIPEKYTGEGHDVSPPLSWTGIPKDTKELALICDDPDAPTPQPWVHWVAYRISPDTDGLPENADGSFAHGQNDFGQLGYGGPMPPEGHGIYHYFFRLYALDKSLNVSPGLTKEQLLGLMKDHILAEAELVGLYERT